jgi:hypothetical protein
MPEKFILEIDPEAFNDIQQAVNYYNTVRKDLGKRFFETVDDHFDLLKNHYFAFAIRYDDIRCMPVKNSHT